MKILITQKDVGREIDLDQIFRSFADLNSPVVDKTQTTQIMAKSAPKRVITKPKRSGWPKGKPRGPKNQTNGTQQNTNPAGHEQMTS